MKFFGGKSVRERLGKTLVTLLSPVRDTKRLVENEITHQIIVDAGAEVGEIEKGVGMEIVARRVRMKKTEDQKIARPRPARHPKARCVNVVVTQDTRR